MDAFESRCVRKILHNAYSLSTLDLWLKARLDESLLFTIQLRSLKWLGHVLRLDPSDIPNVPLQFEKGDVGGRTPDGSKNSWRKIVQMTIESGSNVAKTWYETGSNGEICVGISLAGNGQHCLKSPFLDLNVLNKVRFGYFFALNYPTKFQSLGSVESAGYDKRLCISGYAFFLT